MKEKLKVSNGTRHVEYEEFDLDRYGKAVPTDADDFTWRKAFRLLEATMDDPTFADDGHRNNDAVNGCIALHVMGYEAEAWFENWCAEQRLSKTKWFEEDLDKFMEQVERVAPYLMKWGPRTEESQALTFII